MPLTRNLVSGNVSALSYEAKQLRRVATCVSL
jgi:hypothetical protein